nr:uncharacterized protein LOC127315329 [Lolium perenne]
MAEVQPAAVAWPATSTTMVPGRSQTPPRCRRGLSRTGPSEPGAAVPSSRVITPERGSSPSSPSPSSRRPPGSRCSALPDPDEEERRHRQPGVTVRGGDAPPPLSLTGLFPAEPPGGGEEGGGARAWGR